MDLADALTVVDSPVRLHGRSDSDLVQRVIASPHLAPSAKRPRPAAQLHNGIDCRPLEALHLLSYATRPRYQDDVFDMYLQWGILRYLGFFQIADPDKTPMSLELSPAGRRVTGNQRRITSEEMGIGFGVLLGIRWFQATVGRVPISVVDIDAALDDRYVFAAGTRLTVQERGAQRPDYLLIAHDPGIHSRYRIRALECKGTKTNSYAFKQLAKATGQLSGIRVGNRVPAGLATAVVTSDNQVSYLAVDPPDGEEQSYEVSSRTMPRSDNFRIDSDRIDESAIELVNASVRASWATLADFGGNLEALDRWAPEIMRRRLSRRARERHTFETPLGTARGITTTFEFEGHRLVLRLGLASGIDHQLSTGTVEDITGAQAEFATSLPAHENPSTLSAGTRQVYSATADGSIFSLSLT
ncbi:hypothetical protein ACIBCH_41575 [Amycolatopsis thailandensis]|uniref:hypothetical protein n=1 Tax=Amycolatopsis thailandensis TaxID=589330 RepID=UPI0037B47851